MERWRGETQPSGRLPAPCAAPGACHEPCRSPLLAVTSRRVPPPSPNLPLPLLACSNDIGVLREERAALAAALEASQREARGAGRALAELQAEATDKLGSLTSQNGGLTTELSELRARQGPLLAEVEASRGNLIKLAQEADEARRGRAEALVRLERERQATAGVEAALRDARAGEARLGRALEEEASKGASLRSVVGRLEDALAARDAEVAGLASRLGDAGGELGRAREEAAALRAEADRLGSELVSLARARAGDADAYEARLREAGDDVRRIGEEARGREAAHAGELARRAEELLAARRAGEEVAARLQSDIDGLHELVAEAQAATAAQGRAFDEERAAYERRLGEAATRGSLAAEAHAREAGDLRAANASLSSQVAALREEGSARGERQTGVLAALQATLRALKEEASAVREDYLRVISGVKELHGRVGEAAAVSQAPLTGWYEDTKRALLALSEGAAGAKRAEGDARDQVSEEEEEEERGSVSNSAGTSRPVLARLFLPKRPFRSFHTVSPVCRTRPHRSPSTLSPARSPTQPPPPAAAGLRVRGAGGGARAGAAGGGAAVARGARGGGGARAPGGGGGRGGLPRRRLRRGCPRAGARHRRAAGRGGPHAGGAGPRQQDVAGAAGGDCARAGGDGGGAGQGSGACGRPGGAGGLPAVGHAVARCAAGGRVRRARAAGGTAGGRHRRCGAPGPRAHGPGVAAGGGACLRQGRRGVPLGAGEAADGRTALPGGAVAPDAGAAGSRAGAAAGAAGEQRGAAGGAGRTVRVSAGPGAAAVRSPVWRIRGWQQRLLRRRQPAGGRLLPHRGRRQRVRPWRLLSRGSQATWGPMMGSRSLAGKVSTQTTPNVRARRRQRPGARSRQAAGCLHILRIVLEVMIRVLEFLFAIFVLDLAVEAKDIEHAHARSNREQNEHLVRANAHIL